jgi:hypothetical protein
MICGPSATQRGIRALNSDQLGNLGADQLVLMQSKQIAAISASQVSDLTTSAVAGLPPHGTGQGHQNRHTQQPEQRSAGSAGNRRSGGDEHGAAQPARNVTARVCSAPSQLVALNTRQISTLTTAQIAALDGDPVEQPRQR